MYILESNCAFCKYLELVPYLYFRYFFLCKYFLLLLKHGRVQLFDIWRQCFKCPYFRFTDIFSVFPYFIQGFVYILRKYGENIRKTEKWRFITLALGLVVWMSNLTFGLIQMSNRLNVIVNKLVNERGGLAWTTVNKCRFVIFCKSAP